MAKLKNHFDIKWLVLAVTFTSTVFIFTHIPQRLIPSQMQERGADKLLHFLVYGAITFLFIISLKSSLSMFSVFLLFFFILVIGIFDEITQPLVNRQASLADLLADITGVIVVLLLFIGRKHI
jgi:VanZ family protein